MFKLGGTDRCLLLMVEADAYLMIQMCIFSGRQIRMLFGKADVHTWLYR
jgi:hypothetical protein